MSPARALAELVLVPQVAAGAHSLLGGSDDAVERHIVSLTVEFGSSLTLNQAVHGPLLGNQRAGTGISPLMYSSTQV